MFRILRVISQTRKRCLASQWSLVIGRGRVEGEGGNTWLLVQVLSYD